MYTQLSKHKLRFMLKKKKKLSVRTFKETLTHTHKYCVETDDADDEVGNIVCEGNHLVSLHVRH